MRLIDAELAAARQHDLREPAPTLICGWRCGNAESLHLRDESLNAVAHKIQLVRIILLGLMHGNLGWW